MLKAVAWEGDKKLLSTFGVNLLEMNVPGPICFLVTKVAEELSLYIERE